jgi:hypothetical protein
MAPDPARPARILTFALVGVAYAACEVAAHLDGIPRPFGVTYGIALFVFAAAASYFVPPPATPDQRLPARFAAVLAAVFAVPLMAEPAVRALTNNGLPLELQMTNGLRNLALALAAAAAYPGARRLAGVVSLFLALFASAMGDQAAIPYLLGLLAAVGGLWLVADHRAGLARAAVADPLPDAVVRRAALRLPWKEAVVFGGLLVAAVAVAVAGPKKVRLVLGELLPTSGGTGDSDPFSRGGVNDGPEEAAGDDPTTAGLVDTDNMIETQGDSLLDVVSDMAYGMPHKPRPNQDRMIAGGLAKVKESHKTPENKRPSRPFDTGRKGPPQARKTPGEDARGLFEVEGRTPLHVRAAAYDRYDPATASWLEAERPGSRLLVPEGGERGEWMAPTTVRGRADWYAGDDAHRLKVADLRENLVPTPAMVSRFRIKKVDRVDAYEADADGVWAVAGRRRTPPGVVVNAECRTLDPGRLPADAFATRLLNPTMTEVPAEVRPGVERLAREWAAGKERGWPAVEAVLTRLREDYAIDKTAAAPAGHPAPVLWFLAESRRGPDYLFASAAALALRSLGHPARVCLGFYAAPEAFDPDTGHTPVRADAVHTWAEVQLSDGQWLAVEPTPGYATLPPLRSLQERVLDALAAAGRWAARNAAALAASVIALSLVVRLRRRLADLAYTLAWRLASGRTWDETARRAARLLERRGRLAGRPRPPAETFAAWAATLPVDPTLGEFAALVEWAAYAPGLPPPRPPAEAAAACRACVAGWTYRRLSAPPGAAA